MSDQVVISMLDDDELRAAAVLAHGCTLLAASAEYGFTEGGPAIDVDRAEEVIAIARERGLEWTDDEATDAAVQVADEWNASHADGGES